MSRAILGTFVFVVAGLSGCASPAKVIKSDMTTAVIAVPEDTNTWPFYYGDAAKAAAAEKIAKPFLVSTNRVKVGELTTSTQDVTSRDLGSPDRPKVGEAISSTNRTSTTDKYEYHLVFQSQDPRQLSISTRSTDLPPAPGGSPLTTNSLLPPPATPGSPPAPPLTLTPASATTPRYELPPANDIRPPLSPSPSTNLPSTNITMPGMGSGR